MILIGAFFVDDIMIDGSPADVAKVETETKSEDAIKDPGLLTRTAAARLIGEQWKDYFNIYKSPRIMDYYTNHECRMILQ
jgi:hypothetical protein